MPRYFNTNMTNHPHMPANVSFWVCEKYHIGINCNYSNNYIHLVLSLAIKCVQNIHPKSNSNNLNYHTLHGPHLSLGVCLKTSYMHAIVKHIQIYTQRWVFVCLFSINGMLYEKETIIQAFDSTVLLAAETHPKPMLQVRKNPHTNYLRRTSVHPTGMVLISPAPKGTVQQSCLCKNV